MMRAMRAGGSPSVDEPPVARAVGLAGRMVELTVRGSARLRAFARGHPRALLCLVALMPFVPGLWQILRTGIPDVLFTGDGATLELRVLQAAQGKQWLGPYSRFLWSHPGPAMFYLALPFYEALHQRGAAMNVFVLVASLASSVALALNARRLRGDFFALMTATLLGIYQLLGVPASISSEWNPTVPMIPLALLTILAARLAVGQATAAVLIAFVFVASAIVQTHVGYVPVVLSVAGVALLWSQSRRAARWLGRRRRRQAPGPGPGPRRPASEARLDPDAEQRIPAWGLLASAGVLGAIWALPILENARFRPGNLDQLFLFFTSPHPAEHLWGAAFFEVFEQISVMPLAVVRAFHLATAIQPGWPLVRLLGVAQLLVLGAALATGIRRRDPSLAVLAVLVLVELMAALAAIREIRGEIQSYLVVWISVLGFLTATVAAAWVGRTRASRTTTVAVHRAGIALAVAGLLGLGSSMIRELGRAQLFRQRDVSVEKLVRDVEGHLRAGHTPRPVVHVVAQDSWPAAMAIILHLRKNNLPVAIEQSWIYMVGPSFTPRPTDRYRLNIGDVAVHAAAKSQLDQTLVGAAGDTYAYLQDTLYVQEHRLLPDPASLSASGSIRGDPRIAIDGVIPGEGSIWDSPASVVLASEQSALEVAVPPGDLVGIFLSCDGNDLYSLRCLGADGLRWLVGPTSPDRAEEGMRTRLLFSESLRSCGRIEVKAQSGDGAYSIGELGFLRR